MKQLNIKTFFLAVILMFCLSAVPGVAEPDQKPLVLQEKTWPEVEAYLKTMDMAIIPVGSTEQHGPHLPLGTDFFESFGMAKMISAATGVMVVPVVMAGYSYYHSGFPGTLSLKPETLEQVLFETAEMLIKYGFRRIMFFDYHGGNRVAEQGVIHRINHRTEATALSIGLWANFKREKIDLTHLDWDVHAGIRETSMMLYLKPELVQMSKAEKPEIRYSRKIQSLIKLSESHPDLLTIVGSLQGIPKATGKEGSTREITNNGVMSTGDPARATREMGEQFVRNMVDPAVRFINAWKKVK